VSPPAKPGVYLTELEFDKRSMENDDIGSVDHIEVPNLRLVEKDGNSYHKDYG